MTRAVTRYKISMQILINGMERLRGGKNHKTDLPQIGSDLASPLDASAVTTRPRDGRGLEALLSSALATSESVIGGWQTELARLSSLGLSLICEVCALA